MASKLPRVWAADLVVPVDPAGAAPEQLATQNNVWDSASGEVRLAGGANEVLNFQLVVEKSAGHIEQIEFENAGEVQPGLFQNIAVPLANSDKFHDDPVVPITPGQCGDEIATVTRRSPKLADRARQTFTVELYIPKGVAAGERTIGLNVRARGRDRRVTIRLTVHNFELPDDSGCIADLNAYDMSIAAGFPGSEADFDRYLAIEQNYFRLVRQHRAHLHLLPYGQSGRESATFVPTLAGRGRTRRIDDWSMFDKHWGPYLDGSAYAGCRGRDWPIEYLYSPVNCNWPAFFEKFGTPGYWFEYQTVIRQMAEHFAQRGWTRTKLEVFFNHKSRWKYYPWDMDEIRFDRDNQATIDFASKALEAVRDFPQVQVVNRIDSSWIFEKTARTQIG
ncbi:MAG: hypothetical protein PHU85_10985, partial [Phycisphaerae bacterium]|nr:hypothetical protein [Phycisphaerae bacterium]